jgi:hypothetical protein
MQANSPHPSYLSTFFENKNVTLLFLSLSWDAYSKHIYLTLSAAICVWWIRKHEFRKHKNLEIIHIKMSVCCLLKL